MAAVSAVDVLIVSLGSTAGLRSGDEELAGSLSRAGASVAVAHAIAPRPTRTMMLTDLAWARSARAAAQRAIAAAGPAHPPAVIYSSTTAALFWPRPGAIRFDAPSAGNRPGRHGVWQRPLERRRLREAPLLLPWSEGALAELPAPAANPRCGRALVVPVAVEPSCDGAGEGRDIAAITYASNPLKKGLDRVLSAWRRVLAERAAGRALELVVAGVSERALLQARLLQPGESGVRVVGPLPREQYRALLGRARVFVCAPRREDYGIAQLEALADGCQLVTTPAPGPYAALEIARTLDPRLVGEDLARALRAALEDPRADYPARARAALAPYRRETVDRLVERELLPRLLEAA